MECCVANALTSNDHQILCVTQHIATLAKMWLWTGDMNIRRPTRVNRYLARYFVCRGEKWQNKDRI